MTTRIHWRQKKMCDDCGFCRKGSWERLKAEKPMEWALFQMYVLEDLTFGQVYCHNTPTGPSEPLLLCAGIIAYQTEHYGRPSDLAVSLQREHGESL